MVLCQQRLLDRTAYALRWYPAFNQWLPCSVSLHSDPAVSCRRLCSSPVDAQRLSLLGSFLHRISSTSGYLIEWLMPFTSIRHSTNGYRAVFHRILTRQGHIDVCILAQVDAQRLLNLWRFLLWLSSISGCWIECLMPFAGIRYSTNGYGAVFHCILPRQGRVDAHTLVRWTHSAFRAYGVFFYAGSPPSAIAGSNGLHPSLVSGIQLMVTVQCFTAFCPGRVV